jgi:hypothetical protein
LARRQQGGQCLQHRPCIDSAARKLPKAEHTAPEWQAAMEALMLVATLGGPTTFARIGVMRALSRHIERVFKPRPQRPSLGTSEAGARSMICRVIADPPIAAALVSLNGHMKIRRSPNFADSSQF